MVIEGVVKVSVFDRVGFWSTPPSCQLAKACLVSPAVFQIQAFDAVALEPLG